MRCRLLGNSILQREQVSSGPKGTYMYYACVSLCKYVHVYIYMYLRICMHVQVYACIEVLRLTSQLKYVRLFLDNAAISSGKKIAEMQTARNL